MTDDLSNLPNHCASNHCGWCTERRERRIRQSIEASRPAVVGSIWDMKIGTGDVLGYWSQTIPPSRSDPKITYMKSPRRPGVRHKIVRAWR